MPDEELARLAGVHKTSVRYWRSKRKIRKRKGFQAEQESGETRIAMNLLGEPMDDVLQRTRGTVTSGKWEPPQYCIRRGVDYDKLCWQVYAMHKILGLGLEEIAEAHGYTYKTVADALGIYEDWLRTNGVGCGRCGIAIDPERHYGCSGTCIGM